MWWAAHSSASPRNFSWAHCHSAPPFCLFDISYRTDLSFLDRRRCSISCHDPSAATDRRAGDERGQPVRRFRHARTVINRHAHGPLPQLLKITRSWCFRQNLLKGYALWHPFFPAYPNEKADQKSSYDLRLSGRRRVRFTARRDAETRKRCKIPNRLTDGSCSVLL